MSSLTEERSLTVALPKDEKGHTYVTDEMLAESSELDAFLKRTINSWWRDEVRCMYVLYPTVGRSR